MRKLDATIVWHALQPMLAPAAMSRSAPQT
jgi:hypothetical protein